MGSSAAKGRSGARQILPRLVSRGAAGNRSAHLEAAPPANQDTLKHVAICGVSYCGSTLLARILGSLPGAENIGESHWLLSRREEGVTVPVDPGADDWAVQVHCWGCGPDCEYLTRDFRRGLFADRVHWYHRIAQRLETSILISADKNYNKIVALDPLLRLDALVLFKAPGDAVYSHFRYRGLKGHPEATAKEVRRYLNSWVGAYEAFLDRFDVEGEKIFLSWRRFCEDPARHLARICSLLGLPHDGRVLERIDPEQHSLGGNGRVNRDFRRSASFRIRPPRPRELAPEQEEALARHRRARRAHARLREAHRRVFDERET